MLSFLNSLLSKDLLLEAHPVCLVSPSEVFSVFLSRNCFTIPTSSSSTFTLSTTEVSINLQPYVIATALASVK